MNYYWHRYGNYLLPAGTEPTTDVLLHFGGGDVASAWQEQVLLTCSAEQYCASGALGRLEPAREDRFPYFNGLVRDGLDRLEAARQSKREYSWINYGDTYGERAVNWTDQEYDLQWGLLMNFSRTGDMAFFDRGVEAASHTVQIDMINWSDDPSILGIMKEHSPWHVGGFGTPRPENTTYWFENGIWNTGHVWTQGTYLAYCLTGDRRYFQSIELLSEFLARSRTSFIESWVHRNYGWLTIATLGAYHTTADPYYLNAARFFMQNVVDRQDPGTGGLIHPIGECEHTPRHMGGKSFMTGVVMAGLTMLDEIEPRDDLKRSLTLASDWLWARMWNAEKMGFRYAQCPQFDGGAGVGAGVCMGLAHAYDIAGKPEYRDMLVQSMGRMVREGGPSGSGKGYAVQIRNTPYAIGAMDRWGMTEVPPPPARTPTVQLPAKLYMVPGQVAQLGVVVHYASAAPLDATAEIVRLPAGLKAETATVAWQMQRGATQAPVFRITGQAPDGAEVVVRWQAGEWQGDLTAAVHTRKAMEVGVGVGYVGDDQDPVGLALRTLGLRLEPLADLSPTTLAKYRALIIGREAHEKNFLSIRDNNANLLDFIHAGGTVVMMQIQNSSYQAAWLPAPLAFSNDSGSLGEIVATDHPLFTTPNRIESATGIVSYDTIVEAGDAWIVEMSDGEGTVLVVQPSPERYVVGEAQAQAPLTVEVCAQIMENIVAYLGSAR